MAKKLDDGAFEVYVSLGTERSYQAVADHYGVTKKTVVRHAKEGRWIERLQEIEAEAQKKVDERASETLAEMHSRHLRMLKVVQARALKAVQDYPLTNGVQGMRAIDAAIKLERLIRAEPNEQDQDRQAQDLAHKVRNFVGQLMASVPKEPPIDDVL